MSSLISIFVRTATEMKSIRNGAVGCVVKLLSWNPTLADISSPNMPSSQTCSVMFVENQPKPETLYEDICLNSTPTLPTPLKGGFEKNSNNIVKIIGGTRPNIKTLRVKRQLYPFRPRYHFLWRVRIFHWSELQSGPGYQEIHLQYLWSLLPQQTGRGEAYWSQACHPARDLLPALWKALQEQKFPQSPHQKFSPRLYKLEFMIITLHCQTK